MQPRRRAGFLAALMTLLAGGGFHCSAELTEVRLDDRFDYAFAIFLDAEENPVRVGPVFGSTEEGPFGGNDIDVRDGEQDVLLVVMTEADLAAAVTDFDADRARELTVQLEAPPTRPTLIAGPSSAPPIRRAPLPEEASYYIAALDGRTKDIGTLAELDGPSARIRTAVSLLVPVNPEICRRPDQAPLRPFAAEAHPIDLLRSDNPAAVLAHDLLWLDDDRLLVVGGSQLFVVHRGESWQTSAQNTYRLPPDPRFSRRFHEAVAASAAPDGTRVVWIAGGYPGQGNSPSRRRDGAHGALFKATFGPEGLRTVETATETPGALLWTAAIADDGTVLAGGDGGLLIRKRSDEDSFELAIDLPVSSEEPGVDWVSTIATFDLPAARWVVGTRGIIHEFDASVDLWSEQAVLQDIVISPGLYRFFAVDGRSRGNSDVELWAAASRGGLIRRAGLNSRWAQVKPVFPPRFEPCASAVTSDEEPLNSLKDINDLVLQDGFVHLAYQNCTAVVMLALEDETDPQASAGCASLLTEEGTVPDYTPSEYIAFASRPGELAVLRADGRLLFSTWRK